MLRGWHSMGPPLLLHRSAFLELVGVVKGCGFMCRSEGGDDYLFICSYIPLFLDPRKRLDLCVGCMCMDISGFRVAVIRMCFPLVCPFFF